MCGEWNSSRDYQLPNLSGSPSGHFWSWPTSWRVRGLWLRWGRQNDLGEHPILLLISYDSWFMMYIYIYIFMLDGYQIWDISVLLYIHVRIYIFTYRMNTNCIWDVFFPYFWNQGASCDLALVPTGLTGGGAEKIGAWQPWPWNKSVKSHPLLQRRANARTRSQKKNSVPSVALINTWKVSIIVYSV